MDPLWDSERSGVGPWWPLGWVGQQMGSPGPVERATEVECTAAREEEAGLEEVGGFCGEERQRARACGRLDHGDSQGFPELRDLCFRTRPSSAGGGGASLSPFHRWEHQDERRRLGRAWEMQGCVKALQAGRGGWEGRNCVPFPNASLGVGCSGHLILEHRRLSRENPRQPRL